MPRVGRYVLSILWTLTFLSVAMGSITAYIGPLYWLSAFLLWGTGFCTLAMQAPRLLWRKSAALAWTLFLFGAGAVSLALCYFATSPQLSAGWFVGLTSVLMLLAAPQPPAARWALLATTAGLTLLSWTAMRHTSLLPSIAAGNVDHLHMLLLCGADPNELIKNETPLLDAVRLGRDDLVEMLLRHGADPNGRSGAFTNSTPVLFYAARLPPAQQRVLDLLLQFGADSTLVNGTGQRVRLPAR